MEITYDWKYDILAVYFKPKAHAVDSAEIEPGVTVDLDKDGHMVALEIMDARDRYGLAAVESVKVTQDTTAALRQRPAGGRKVLKRQGQQEEAGDDPDAGAVWVSVPYAAELKGVTAPTIRRAIELGQIEARPQRPGATWTMVREQSLAAWEPDRARQAAGKARSAVSE